MQSLHNVPRVKIASGVCMSDEMSSKFMTTIRSLVPDFQYLYRSRQRTGRSPQGVKRVEKSSVYCSSVRGPRFHGVIK